MFFETILPLILITLMGNTSFKVREAATAEMERRGALVLPYLEYAATKCEPEVQWRAKKLMEKCVSYWDDEASKMLCSYQPVPWIDSFKFVVGDSFYVHAHRLAEEARIVYGFLPTNDDKEFASYRWGTHIWVKNRLRQGEDPKLVEKDVKDMYEICARWDGISCHDPRPPK